MGLLIRTKRDRPRNHQVGTANLVYNDKSNALSPAHDRRRTTLQFAKTPHSTSRSEQAKIQSASVCWTTDSAGITR
jgi:hypothetical protein